MSDKQLDDRQRRALKIVIGYPLIVLLVAIAVNHFLLDIRPFVPAVPERATLLALAIAAILLALNHSWIMTATETKRVRYRMHATPEEWKASGTSWSDISEHGIRELERTHNAHRNSTENSVHFALLCSAFLMASPAPDAAMFWMPCFAFARLGYTFSYLRGQDNLRSLFMTLSLFAMYGIGSHLIISLMPVS